MKTILLTIFFGLIIPRLSVFNGSGLKALYEIFIMTSPLLIIFSALFIFMSSAFHEETLLKSVIRFLGFSKYYLLVFFILVNVFVWTQHISSPEEFTIMCREFDDGTYCLEVPNEYLLNLSRSNN